MADHPDKPIYFITSNLDKVSEVSALLGIPLAPAALALNEIQSLSAETVVKDKFYQAYAKLKAPVIVDDTSLSLDAYGRFPGPFIKFLLDEAGLEAVCTMAIDDKGAVAQTVLGYYDQKNTIISTGTVHGTIADAPRGEHGFGWDSIFIPDGHDETFAEMTADEKNAVSMRHLAAADLKKKLAPIIASPAHS